MQIQQENDLDKGSFFMMENGVRIAELTYSWNNNEMVIDHTEVNADYESQGLGKQLVYFAMAYAGNNNSTILPLCTFAKSVIEKKKQLLSEACFIVFDFDVVILLNITH